MEASDERRRRHEQFLVLPYKNGKEQPNSSNAGGLGVSLMQLCIARKHFGEVMPHRAVLTALVPA